MWAISNRTPYAADGTWCRDRDGVHQWIVAVKATYSIDPTGVIQLSQEQEPLLLLPEYHGEPGQSSLRYDADLIAQKPATDVIVNGTAYAPSGRPTTEFFVRLAVGPIDKTLRVVGNRYGRDRARSMGSFLVEPVATVPVRYERAFGGYDASSPDPRQHRLDTRNPVGCGLIGQSGRPIGERQPNFEYPDKDVEKAGPAGFGAIDSFWSPRREIQGTFDSRWRETRLPLLPADWDPRALLSAPLDQQAAQYLRGGEEVELVNLSPSGHMRFRLPKVHLTFSTFVRGRQTEHRSRLVTVAIEPDDSRLIMTWVSALPVVDEVEDLDVTVVAEKEFLA